MVYKLTQKKHLQPFTKEVNRFAKKLGLHDWEIACDLVEMTDAVASCQADADGRLSIIHLAKEWIDQEPTLYEVRSCARHEVLELLLWDLCDLIRNRFITEAEVNRTRHALVRRLEKVLNE